MCEFRILLNGKNVLEDVVYAKDDGKRLIFRTILGEAKEFPLCRIVEVNVEKEELIIVQK